MGEALKVPWSHAYQIVEATMNKTKIYCTTFCNQGHRVDTGRPVGHECHILRPEALRLEMAGDIEGALRVGIKTDKVVRGRS